MKKLSIFFFAVLQTPVSPTPNNIMHYKYFQSCIESLTSVPLESRLFLLAPSSPSNNNSNSSSEVFNLQSIIFESIIVKHQKPVETGHIMLPLQKRGDSRKVNLSALPKYKPYLDKKYWIFLLASEGNIKLFLSLLGLEFRHLNMNYLIVVSPSKISQVKLAYIIKDLVHLSPTFVKFYCTFCPVVRKWLTYNGLHPKFHNIPKSYQGYCFIYPLVKLKPLKWDNFSLFHDMAMEVQLHKKPEKFVISSLMPGPHSIIPRYLMYKYNGSFTTCQDLEHVRGNQSKGGYYFRYVTINFKIIIHEEKARSNRRSYVVSTGLEICVKFITPLRTSRRQQWLSLLGPLGFDVFISVILLIPFMTGITYFGMKVYSLSKNCTEEKTPRLEDIAGSIFRPLLDQCLENLSYKQLYFRIILSVWLFYCLLVSETYRGELASYLTKPSEAEYIRTFYDLAYKGWKSGTPLKTFNNVHQTIGEIAKTLHSANQTEWQLGKRYNIFHYLGLRLKRWMNMNKSDEYFIHKFFRGKLHIIDKVETLNLLTSTMESYLGESYKISDESITNYEFWSVMPGPFERDIVRDINWCRDYGLFTYLFQQYRVMADEMGRIRIKDMIFNFTKAHGGIANWMVDSENIMGPKKLKLRNFGPIFAILAIGFLLSIGIWMRELYKLWRMKKDICNEFRAPKNREVLQILVKPKY